MKFNHVIVSIAFFMLGLNTAYAAKHYRHIPFSISLAPADVLVVNYNFAEKNGIHCRSSNRQSIIEFVYKGRQKSTHLPVTLQSAHIPHNDHEELTDLAGQFTISLYNSETSHQDYTVNCEYAEGAV